MDLCGNISTVLAVGKVIFWENNIFRNIFRNGVKTFRTFGEIFSAGLSKVNSTFLEEQFRKILIFGEIIFSVFFGF